MPFKLGPLELVLILVIVFIIFGAGKLPQIFGSVGKAMKNFREARTTTMKRKSKRSNPAARPGKKQPANLPENCA